MRNPRAEALGSLYITLKEMDMAFLENKNQWEKKKQQRRSLLFKIIKWWFNGSWWPGRILKMILFLYMIYCGYACAIIRRPPVHGIVVDGDTGEPIQGAEVCVETRYTVLLPIETAENQRGARGSVITDRKGRFHISGANCLKAEEIKKSFGLLIIPKWANNVEARIYSKDYITQNAGSPPWAWFIYFISPTKPVILSRWRLPLLGYWCKIRMFKPVDEASWITKCEQTMRAHQILSDDISGEWLFNDLEEYLERYPQGEKSGEYFNKVLEMTNIISCSYARDALRRGVITIEELEIHLMKATQHLHLAQKMKGPPKGIQGEKFLKSNEYRQEQINCVAELLDHKKKIK